MKKIVLLLVVAVFGVLSANAQEEGRLVVSAGQLKNLSLGDNMKVVLVSTETPQNEIKGDMSFFQKLNLSVSNGTMYIAHGKKFPAGQTVFIEVGQLDHLSLGQNTQVDTKGFLKGNIKLLVREGSIARIRTSGDVDAEAYDHLEFSIKKTPVTIGAF